MYARIENEFLTDCAKYPLSRILLVAVAIFSLYSVHLLLKTANEGGE